MGGIRTDYRGESQTMKGLFSCGEAACWDLHGFNRLGGNSVAETVVSGMLVAEYVSDYCDSQESNIDISTNLIETFIKCEQDKLDELLEPKENPEDGYKLRARMEDIMMDKVGIFRNGKDLEEAVNELEELIVRSRNIEVKAKTLTANPELFNAYRTQRMLKLAICTAKGALDRKESRGAHSREDYPERNDAEYLNRTITTWPDPTQTTPTVTYENIDINEMEMPPGFRGYGKDMTIHHDDSAIRQDAVDKIREELEAEGKDRFEIQEAIMPYRSELPKCYQGKNERLYEKFEGGAK
jgi:fumarate reductase flavoprotein subunit